LFAETKRRELAKERKSERRTVRADATVSKVRQCLQISTLVSLVMGRWLNSINLRIKDETLVLPGLIVADVSAAFPASFVEFYMVRSGRRRGKQALSPGDDDRSI
jgi:hypothetical protein